MNQRVIYQASDSNSPLRQGEILTGVIQYNPDSKMLEESQQSGNLTFIPISHPYAIVITQDCDLDWDYKARHDNSMSSAKLLNSITLCEIAKASEIRDKDGVNRKEWELVSSHRHERYYFFEKILPEFELQEEGLPELTADFKRVFCLDSDTLYRSIEVGFVKRRSILVSPYLEHFSGRYHNFQSRIALPFQYESERGN